MVASHIMNSSSTIDAYMGQWTRSQLRLRQNGCHFADKIFKCIFLNENVWILLKILLKFVPEVWINNIPALVQVMALHWPAIIWTNDGWFTDAYMSLSLNELMAFVHSVLSHYWNQHWFIFSWTISITPQWKFTKIIYKKRESMFWAKCQPFCQGPSVLPQMRYHLC